MGVSGRLGSGAVKEFAERSANSIGLEQETVVPMGAVDDLILGFDTSVASEVSQVDL